MAAREVQEGVAERLRRRYFLDEAWAASRMPSRHRGGLCTALSWPRPDRVALARQVIRSGGNLVLLGPRGTGKTQLAVQFMAWCIEELSGTAQYWTAADLFDELRKGFEKPAAESESFRARLQTVRLLVIDELRERAHTEFEDRELTRIFDARYSSGRSTILVSNATPAEIMKELGPSIVSRLNETGQIFVCDWQSFREGTPRR